MTLHATWFNQNNWFQSKFNWLWFKFLSWIQKHWMEFKSIGIEFKFNLIWRGETKIDAKILKICLPSPTFVIMVLKKKACYEKTQTHIWECIFSFHLEKISHQKIYFGRMK